MRTIPDGDDPDVYQGLCEEPIDPFYLSPEMPLGRQPRGPRKRIRRTLRRIDTSK